MSQGEGKGFSVRGRELDLEVDGYVYLSSYKIITQTSPAPRNSSW